MKKTLIIGISGILLLTGCGNKQENETVSVPKAQVAAVTFKSGKISDEISLQAQSVYTIKNGISAPINGYIQKSLVVQGEKVQLGQTLFILATKERKAAEQLSAKDSTYNNIGVIKIKANCSGIVSSMVSQTGDYVTEGTQLCQISNVNSLVFTLQVPAEYNNLIKAGAACKIDMPDGSNISGTIKNELDKMNLNGQTRQYFVKPLSNAFIPENLLASVRITTKATSSAQILPISCLLTDEMMQNFWIMKLINDSTAVKVLVKTGLKNKDEVIISEPLFSSSDRILSSGNYGLADTAFVNVEKR
jgi:biotin carboxyl carrier protein